ncbi:acyltransferase family protein [Levilactobacillus fuyuanensis]|uniref:Acyltransferase family protein n=1 Tax=Levilactobacillus fuyuanensis TaxID=2486022 RepID=A0ABW4H583_9LACO|nr:acyltransferase [Levilactobacillus fuyuanensis]
MGKKRIRTFDIAKGIAILLVVFGHALQGMRDSEGITVNSLHSSIYIICSIIYTFHMPLFFFVSGLFVHSWSRRPAGKAIWQKIKLLVVPYIIWTVIVGSFMQLAQKYTNNGLGLRQVLLAWWVPFSEYWFLYVLFIVYMIYYVFVHFIKNGEKILLVLSVLMYVLVPLGFNFWIVAKLQKFLIFFMLGSMISKYLLSNYNTIFTMKKSFGITAMFLVAIILYVYLIKNGVDSAIMNVYVLLMSILGISFVMIISHVIDRRDNEITLFLNWNGMKSMAIYVMHLLPLAGSRILAVKLMHMTNLWGIIVVITLISLLSCYIGYFILRKMRLTNIMFGR